MDHVTSGEYQKYYSFSDPSKHWGQSYIAIGVGCLQRSDTYNILEVILIYENC